MEPLPEGSGRDLDPAPEIICGELQWSRFPKEAEGQRKSPYSNAGGELQWSRFPKEAEGI